MPKSHWAGHELENTTLYGKDATLRLNPAALFTMNGQERIETPLDLGPEADQFENQLLDFLGAVKTGKLPTNNVDQAVELMKMLMAIYDSSSKNAEVQLA